MILAEGGPDERRKKRAMTEKFEIRAPGVKAVSTATIEAPYDRAPIAEVEQTDAVGVDRALQTAHDVFRDRDAWLTPARRIEILGKAASIMAGRREELARESAREGGKPLGDSLIEIDRAIDGVAGCIETLRTQGGREIPMRVNAASANRIAFTHLEPIGPVVAFSAFNHPLNLIVHQAYPAVAAGCPVIVKPAEATPLSALRLVSILHEAGLPPENAQVLATVDEAARDALVTDPRIAFFSFIGQARVGWGIRSRLAPGVRCALEHGGVAPVIVAADADLDDALPLLLKAGFYHAGQVCVSVQRVFADRSIARELADRLATGARGLDVGDPLSIDTEVGPLIRPSEVDRVEEWCREAREGGAEVLCGGERRSDTCFSPTVLFDPPAGARVSTEEIFGPVVCVYPVDSLDEAVARSNSLRFAFQASVFTRDLDRSMRAMRRLDAAAVMINDHTAFRVDWMPFGGRRESGLGIGGIPHTMADMQTEKLTVIRSGELGV